MVLTIGGNHSIDIKLCSPPFFILCPCLMTGCIIDASFCLDMFLSTIFILIEVSAY